MALLSVMLVVALVTVTAAAMASRHQLEIRRTANLIDAEQAFWHTLGVEAWALGQLARDREEDPPNVDGLGDAWARPLGPVTVDGGQAAGRVEDLQGRFNLNGLLREGEPDDFQVECLDRLIATVGASPGIRNAVLDWIDPDSEPRFPDGAEDEVYLKLTPSRRAANKPMVTVSELRTIAGVSAEDYERLAPYLTALPEPTPVNLNTALVPVLMAMVKDLREDDAKSFANARQSGPFETVDEALQHSAFAGLVVNAGGLSVGSKYFRIQATAISGRGRAELLSMAVRPDGEPVRVLTRERGTR